MFFRLFEYALKNITRNTFLSLSSVLILTLLIFFINILVVLHDVSFRMIDGINEKLTISLYLNDEYDKNSLEVIDLQTDITNLIPGVAVQYKTKDELLEEIRARDPELVKILERQNPLPETIKVAQIPLKDYEKLNALIEGRLFLLSESNSEENKEYFSSYTKQYQRIQNVINLLGILQIGLYIIIVTFVISIAVIVYSIIGNFIYYYKDEIYITRLVGGSKIFIYGPFSLQGMIYVSLACIISMVLFLLLLENVKYVFLTEENGEIFSGNLSAILLLEGVVFVAIGGISGFLSSRKYVK